MEDLPELSRCADATWRVLGLSPELLESCRAELRQLAGVFRAHFVLARDRQGAIIGFHAHVPLVRETRDLLLGTVSPGLYLRTLAPDRLSAWEGRTLCACFLATRNAEGELYRALLREFCADFHRYDRVVGVAPQTHGGRAEGGIGHLMSMLGMRRVPGFRVRQPDVALPLCA